MKLISKRIISLLLVFVMLSGMVPMSAFATDETESTEITDDVELFVEATVENDALDVITVLELFEEADPTEATLTP